MNNADWPAFQSECNARTSLFDDEITALLHDFKHDRWTPNTRARIQKLAPDLQAAILGSAMPGVGKVAITPKYSPVKSHWWTPKVDELIAEKRLAHNAWCSEKRKSKKMKLKDKYDALSSNLTHYTEILRRSRWQKFCNRFENPKQIYALLQRSRGSSSIPSFFAFPGGPPCTSDAEKATAFNNGYGKIGTAEAKDHDNKFRNSVKRELKDRRSKGLLSQHRWLHYEAFNQSTSAANVRTVLRGLRKKGAPGIDGLTNAFLSRLPELTIKRLASFFKLSLAAGVFPDVWKVAVLFPIPKSNKAPIVATDMRPIALLSCLGKAFERVVHSSIVDWVETAGILPPEQVGFIKGKSTTVHLSSITQSNIVQTCVEISSLSVSTLISRKHTTVSGAMV